MTTHRDRMLNVLEKRPFDRLPWMPRLEMWYKAHQIAGTLPAKYRGWDVRSIYRDQDMGFHGKWGHVFRTDIEGVETITRHKGEETRRETVTPVGAVSTVERDSPELRAQGIHGLEVESAIKGPEDYAVMEWIYEHTVFTPTYEEYRAFDMECGDDGIPMVNTPWTPADYLLGQLIGYNQAFYHLYDYPQLIQRLLKVMTDKYWEMHRIMAESPALIVSHGAHFSSQMTPPPIFREYNLPYLKEVSAYYHAHGKLLQFHGDDDISGLEEMILEAGYDIAECMVTAPMVPITLQRLREVWGTRITIWGAIPSIITCDPYTDDEFESYMHDLFRTIAPGGAIILGIADMAVPATKWERMERVGQMVKQYGQYPIDASRV